MIHLKHNYPLITKPYESIKKQQGYYCWKYSLIEQLRTIYHARMRRGKESYVVWLGAANIAKLGCYPGLIRKANYCRRSELPVLRWFSFGNRRLAHSRWPDVSSNTESFGQEVSYAYVNFWWGELWRNMAWAAQFSWLEYSNK